MDAFKPHDGMNTISASQYPLDCAELAPYLNGDYAKALPILYDSGRVYINNIVINGDSPTINGGKLMYKNEDGSYYWEAHIAKRGQAATREEAITLLLNGFSSLKRTYYDVSVTDGQIDGLFFTVHDFCFAKTVEIGDTVTKITVCGDEIGADARINPSLIEFPNANVFPDSAGNMPSDQCGVIYWTDPTGWCLRRADCVQMDATPDTEVTACLINRGWSMPWHRPTQPISAIGWMDEGHADIYVWMYDADSMGGVSRVDAQSSLKAAIGRSEDTLKRIVPSADGQNVPAGALWAPQERIDAFRELFENAQKVAFTDHLYNSDYEKSLYLLAIAYGGTGKYSRMYNIFRDGVGIINYSTLGNSQ